MSNQAAVCVQLSKHVHDLVFSFAGRSYNDSYFTVYQLDNGERETRLCTFPVDPNGKYLTAYVEEAISSFAERGLNLTGFAMFLSQENQHGLFEWWSLATDNQIDIEASHFVPFVNEDGVFDYMALTANPRRGDDKEAMQPLMEATNCVWSMAVAKGAADLDVALTTPEPVQA